MYTALPLDSAMSVKIWLFYRAQLNLSPSRVGQLKKYQDKWSEKTKPKP